MEYLTTYGWAVLVILVVGVALWKMGIFSHLSKTVSRCNDFEEIKCFDPTVQYISGSSRVLNATLTNALGSTIHITNVEAREDCVFTNNPDTTLMGGGPGVNISVDAGNIIHFTCPTANLADKPVGDPFSVEVTITYRETVAGEELTRKESGRLKGFAE
ncbi:MAG: hypothetical protein JW778_07570 [Candidatus Altiarchaeota archaeon]|nr:hypothetical protein [Candidatus Altiarchaeota archaeon]